MLKAFIVDDEPLARDELKYLLRRTKQVEIAGEADCIEDALAAMENISFDVLFADIMLAHETGLDLVEELTERDLQPAIVFATAYDEYAIKAFELNAVDYILKPFDEHRVQQTVEKILRLDNGGKKPQVIERKPPSDKLAITVEERIIIIHTHDILYMRTMEGKTIITTDKQEYKVSDSLVAFERKLQDTSIVRVHRAYLVNLDAIVEIQPWFNSTYNIIMKDGESVPVSRTYTKELKQLIGF
ncbi:LytTR family transcriptional regulator DNA-binding domain-containing protein [Bacillus sp. FJAT-49736]|uniref:LytR/AlgR family response regulator transcription factor n=1 Tax=Bacillus sp. FJAT-49736 TaxID=2833582 RepID=UPI001BC8D306|nr:LytTR family transcriptional regulator DNA-binding domain-containing protein [Bacillus sp. FJAT-49736]MBS4174629.1 LytTR family transcriptional regulator DNA-binding domain-containing protein [Bacillus sp. FJAT-49736]